MSVYTFSPEARGDLIEIWKYIANDNINAADDVRREIFAAIHRLAKTPGLGHWRRDLTEREFRFWRVHSYLIVYNPNARPIEVVRVLSSYRDVSAVLGGQIG